jgi:hypothetical protein
MVCSAPRRGNAEILSIQNFTLIRNITSPLSGLGLFLHFLPKVPAFGNFTDIKPLSSIHGFRSILAGCLLCSCSAELFFLASLALQRCTQCLLQRMRFLPLNGSNRSITLDFHKD